MLNLWTSLFLCFLCSSSITVGFTGSGKNSGDVSIKRNPFTPKGYLIRYWNNKIQSEITESNFLLSKASPLNAIDSAAYSKLAAENALSSTLSTFCSAAKLFCFPELAAATTQEQHDNDSSFTEYLSKGFNNYGTDAKTGTNSFQSYSANNPFWNTPVDSFRRYSRDSTNHQEQFSTYATGSNVVDQSFTTYGASAKSGTGDFSAYDQMVNSANLRFTSYSDDSKVRNQKFSSYNQNSNVGGHSFTSYGKNGKGDPNEFKSYAFDTNVIGSDFNNYGETGNGGNDSFTSYGDGGNVPQNRFKNYGDGGKSAVESFSSYRVDSNVGDDGFQTYAKDSNSAKVKFDNYGNTYNPGQTNFTSYGEDAKGNSIDFKNYGRVPNVSFKEYTKNGVTFKEYSNGSSVRPPASAGTGGNSVNKWVESGKFFRESMLKEGIVMPMPDIRDKMPERAFLPRSIILKLPFSSSMIVEMKKIFHAAGNSSMERIMLDALKECERASSAGETKRCVASPEDMIDFATSVLGRNVALRKTENINGSKKNIMIGSVKGINGGKVTESVSCHQSLYPYLLYYCHSVPNVRVYEVDILDPTSKAKINHGNAICHLDTSSWSAGHGAFLALGSGPGLIEVCHWIFENDLTWAIA